MRAPSKKIGMLVATLVLLALSGLAYAAAPNKDMTSSGGSGAGLPSANALYVTGQGPNFELAHFWGYRPYIGPIVRTIGPIVRTTPLMGPLPTIPTITDITPISVTIVAISGISGTVATDKSQEAATN